LHSVKVPYFDCPGKGRWKITHAASADLKGKEKEGRKAFSAVGAIKKGLSIR